MRRAALVAALVATTSSGCLMTRYLSQAVHGQAEMLGAGRPIDEVIADPDVAPRTRMLLAEIPEIRAYGAAYGLNTKHNYTTYLELKGAGAVWFVGASDPLAFRPRRWCFPIAGCFAGLGWFDQQDAIEQRLQLEAKGLDAIARPAGAYSTGGWLPDPVVSTMLSDGDDAYASLANVILHESTHATVLVPDQPFFNESFAEYIGDRLTDQWVVTHLGDGSPEQVLWQVGQAVRQARTARMFAAYAALDVLYKSDQPPAAKLAAKTQIIDDLVADLHLRNRPNNASLIELRVYKAGATALAEAHRACGDIRALLQAAHHLARSDFKEALQSDLAPIGARLAELCRRAPTKP